MCLFSKIKMIRFHNIVFFNIKLMPPLYKCCPPINTALQSWKIAMAFNWINLLMKPLKSLKDIISIIPPANFSLTCLKFSAELIMKGCSRAIQQFNTLTPQSDWHLISPYHIPPESNIKVWRKKELITNYRSSWLLDKFSMLAS